MFPRPRWAGGAATPNPTPPFGAQWGGEPAEKGWAALHAELAQVDPVTAARLNPADSQRIQRALEVYRASGQPLSSFHKSKMIATCADGTGATALNGTQKAINNPLLISLEPQDRAWLHQRIAQRFDAMLASGFMEEIIGLRARGDLHLDLPAMRCVGYRQAWEALDGLWPLVGLRDKGIFATRQLAKRQITWLRSMPQRRIVACDDATALAQVMAWVQHFVDAPA